MSTLDLIGFGTHGYGRLIASGLALTVAIGLVSFVIALVLGVALAQVSVASRLLGRCWSIYASILTGIPSLLALFFVYYNLGPLASAILGVRVQVDPAAACVAALSVAYSAFVGEVVRAAILNVPRGLPEAGRALGLRGWHVAAFITMPMTWRAALPGLANVFVILIKDTALVSLVGLTDVVRAANVASSATQLPFLFFGITALLFVAAIAVGLAVFSLIERRGSLPGDQTGIVAPKSGPVAA